MNVKDLTREQLADWLETSPIFRSLRETPSHAFLLEIADRLRGPDYEAEAKAWREALDTGTIEIKATGEWGYRTRQDEEDFQPVRNIRTANEQKEKGNG